MFFIDIDWRGIRIIIHNPEIITQEDTNYKHQNGGTCMCGIGDACSQIKDVRCMIIRVVNIVCTSLGNPNDILTNSNSFSLYKWVTSILELAT